MTDPSADRIIGLYADKAGGWIVDRGDVLRRDSGPVAGLDEAGWFERFMAALPPGGSVLDVGCGSGWPVAAALLARGFHVTGVDPAPGLLAHAARTLPTGDWIAGDMRTPDLDRRFDGLLAWNSLFHLTPDDQRAALPPILAHAAPTCVILFSTGQAAAEAIGRWRGEPLYHASLDPEDYRKILADHGFTADPSGPDDQRPPAFVWLARRKTRQRAATHRAARMTGR